jgi:hypothetical protein
MHNQLLGRNRGIQSLSSLLSEVLTTFGMHKLRRAGKRRRQNNWGRSSLFIANGSCKQAMFYSCCEINWHCWHIVWRIERKAKLLFFLFNTIVIYICWVK